MPSSCVRALNGPGFVISVNAIIAGTSAAPSVTISTPGRENSAGVPIICSPVSASSTLNSGGTGTGSGVNSTAMSGPDSSAPSAAKLLGDMSIMSAKGAIATGKRLASVPPSARSRCLVVSALQIGRSSGWIGGTSDMRRFAPDFPRTEQEAPTKSSVA
ncbi:hypothetical protein ACVWY2_000712 [Bradyrhizobium sp. JR6.1]